MHRMLPQVRMPRILTTLTSSSGAALLLVGCLASGDVNVDEALSLYYQNELDGARIRLEHAVEAHPDDPAARAWLGETYRRLGFREKAIAAARKVLRLDPCNTFGHNVIADATRTLGGTSDTAWSHLNEAISCDPSDGNVWVSIWGEAVHRQDPNMWRKANRSLVESGFLTKAAINYGRWLLRTLPDGAILLTNGDMDTYPALAVQHSEGFRSDVTVIERGLLDLSWGARFVRDHQGVALPHPTDSLLDNWTVHETVQNDRTSLSLQIADGWVREYVAGSFRRPVCVAVTVQEDFRKSMPGRWQYSGPFWIVQRDPMAQGHDTTAIKASIDGISIEGFAGPWVSGQDRSPVRAVSTKQLARTITSMALLYGEWLVEEGRFSDAQTMVTWAERFESTTVLGSTYGERIEDIRASINSKKQN